MTKNKLYTFVFIACFFGLAYLFYQIKYSESSHLMVCFIKNVTGYSCPSCGTTRAVQLFLQGNFVASLQMNPFGIIVAILIVIAPIWILFDVFTKKEAFYFWYKKTETIIRTKWIAIPLIILVLLNWIWNIYKGL
jgi:hypothetical protein